MVKNLYTKYTQKSRMFLYPLLGIKRGSAVVPNETYVSITNMYKPEDMKLICLYHLRQDLEFRLFEKSKLSGNSRFDTFYEVEDDKGIYVFDFNHKSEMWSLFLAGKYSQIDNNTKNEILGFFANNPSNRNLINSYLNPENYFKSYSEYLNVPVDLMREVGELCSVPDLEKETLKVDVKQDKFLSIFEL